jgi:uncharacterized RmlC-like cupin family protein
MKKLSIAFACLGLGAAVLGLARIASTDDVPAGSDQPIVLTDTDLTWSDAEGMPPGTQLALLAGDPSRSGPFTIRLKVPAGWRIEPHTHPAAEEVTVLSGSAAIGFGERFDESIMKELPTGSFLRLPAGNKHFASSREGAVLEVHATGPWAVDYLHAEPGPK